MSIVLKCEDQISVPRYLQKLMKMAYLIRRMYCSLGACKEGFLTGCRKVIGIHGYFLKTVYHGQLLSVVGLDANNRIFPIAYAIVRVENEDK
ncbi:hypothetical protein LINPERHAP2_LOCUS36064 [Linum perenne]